MTAGRFDAVHSLPNGRISRGRMANLPQIRRRSRNGPGPLVLATSGWDATSYGIVDWDFWGEFAVHNRDVINGARFGIGAETC